ncbi:unnamed protein product [Prunus armeniaca]
MGYVDGTIVCPSQQLSGSTTTNPAYTTWVQYDQMILSWINGSLTPSVLSVVASKKTFRATWEALEQRYASTSQNRILFLRNELIQTKKIILNNLGPAYEMTVNAAQARDTPITYPTLKALLLTTERRMTEQATPLVEAASVNAFVTARGRGGRFHGNGRGIVPAGCGGVNPRPNPYNNNVRPNYANNGERFNGAGERITCQICGKPGHPALDCYQRMNTAYEGRVPAKKLTAMATSPITLNRQTNGQWLLDTGANAHVTPDLQNLVNPKEYNGNENVGGDLKTRKTLFHGRCENGLYPFSGGGGQFNYPILVCVGIRVSAQKWHSRLGHPTSSTVKFLISNKKVPVLGASNDLKTRKTLFHGRCENGLYPFSVGGGQFNYPILVCVGIQVSAQKWHSCLGHPTSSTVKFLISNKKVPVLGASNVTFYLSTRRIYLSRHVLFDEDTFPFKELTSSLDSVGTTGSNTSPNLLFTFPLLSPSPQANPLSPSPPLQSLHQPNTIASDIPNPTNLLSTPALLDPLATANPMPLQISRPTISSSHEQEAVPVPELNQSVLTDTHGASSSNPQSIQPQRMTTRSQSGIHKCNPKYALHVNIDHSLVEPTCYSQAFKQHEWRNAMVQECNALQRCGTWKLVPYHPQMNLLPNKWVFKLKQRANGSIERYKARLVANRFHQKPGIDYTETFSPVVKHSTIRLVLSLEVSKQWPIRQLDVQNAFLHGFLNEDVYMRQPAGFVDQQYPNYVCKLQRSIYGLKQAPRAWFHWFSEFLLQLGFEASTCDYSLFVYNHRGVEVQYMNDQMHLSQAKYALDLLKRTNFLDAKPISTPVPCGQKLSAYDGEPHDNPDLYRSVCQFMHSPTTTHWTTVKRILRYVKATYNHGLLYKPGLSHLTTFSDADYARNPDTRHSTGGFCIYFGSNLVSWSSKKHKTVSRSSSEAEYRQLAYTAAELSWLKSLFRDLKLHLVCPTIWCDNISSIALASNPVFHSRTKHLEVEKVVRGQLMVNYICSQDQIADLFTKGMSSLRFKFLVSKLSVASPPVSLRGDVRPSPTLPTVSRVCDQVNLLSTKILVSSPSEGCNQGEIIVLTVGSGGWRNVGNFVYPFPFGYQSCGIFHNGFLHWISQCGDNSALICAFDLESERFQELLLPPCSWEKLLISLGVLKGWLSIFFPSKGNINVWVMKDYGVKESWTKELVLKQVILVTQLALLLPKGSIRAAVDGIPLMVEAFVYIPSFVSLNDAIMDLSSKKYGHGYGYGDTIRHDTGIQDTSLN